MPRASFFATSVRHLHSDHNSRLAGKTVYPKAVDFIARTHTVEPLQ